MKAKELREKSVEELNTELLNLLREQFNLRMQAASGQLQVQQLGVQLFNALLTQLFCFHYITVLVTKVVLIGSFAAASLNASRASSSGTPSISYRTLPG